MEFSWCGESQYRDVIVIVTVIVKLSFFRKIPYFIFTFCTMHTLELTRMLKEDVDVRVESSLILLCDSDCDIFQERGQNPVSWGSAGEKGRKGETER